MAKVVFDALDPDPSCFNPPPTNPLQQDTCKVTGTFHNREDLQSQQPPILFQRDKDHYILNPGEPSKIAVLQGLGFNEKDPSVQGALHYSVFLNKTHKNFYPLFQSASKYNGPDLLPLTKKMDDFIVVGDIENPDEKQRKTTADLLKSVLSYSDPQRDWFLRPLKTLLNEPLAPGEEKPSETPIAIPVPIRPRLQWMRDQFKIHDDLRNTFSAVQDAALKKRGEDWVLSALIFIETGEGDWRALRDEFDGLAVGCVQLYPNDAQLKDVFQAVYKKMDGFAKNPFFNKNSEALRRVLLVTSHLREGTDTHRAELLSLDSPTAFQRSLTYQLEGVAENNILSTTVKGEMEQSGMDTGRLKDLTKQTTPALISHFSLVQEPGKPPRVKINADSLINEAQSLIKTNPTREREYTISVLAVLRHLLGPNLSGYKIAAWVNRQPTQVEVDLSPQDRKKLQDYSEGLTRKISKAAPKTSVALPIGESILLAAGTALTIGSHVADGNKMTPLNLIGPTLAGAGGSALICHFVLKTGNQYLSDSLCGLGGGGVGFTAAYLAANAEGPQTPNLSGRNPVKGYGP
jgi:hypothetical protein